MEAKDWRISDAAAYMLPMFAFLAITGIGSQWPSIYPAGYIAKTILTATVLIALRTYYTKISWRFWWLGILLGILGTAQWIGMQKFMIQEWPNYFGGQTDDHSPDKIAAPAMRLTYLIFRLGGPVLVVPFMEELFWRDYLWRTMIDLDEFKRAKIGQWSLLSLVVVTGAFASVHGMQQFLTAIVWGLMIASLLLTTKSLGACIWMHATTNLLLGIWVMVHHDWSFW